MCYSQRFQAETPVTHPSSASGRASCDYTTIFVRIYTLLQTVPAAVPVTIHEAAHLWVSSVPHLVYIAPLASHGALTSRGKFLHFLLTDVLSDVLSGTEPSSQNSLSLVQSPRPSLRRQLFPCYINLRYMIALEIISDTSAFHMMFCRFLTLAVIRGLLGCWPHRLYPLP